MASLSNKQHKREDELIPQGITNNRGRGSYASSSARGIRAGTDHVSTFAVVPEHTNLQADNNTSGTAGARFNVETVPNALEEHFKKPVLSRQELIASLKQTCASYYTKERKEKGVTSDDIKMEAASETETEDINVIHTGSNGFMIACMTAFAQHLPLELTPDHVWVLISYAFAKHVDQNAEALRYNFVQHEGKKRLLVVTPDNFRMSSGNNPDTGAPAKEWETFVFPGFSKQIKEYVGEKTHQAIAADFTTTTAASRAAHQICLMSAMKNYFSYGMRTACGIPAITLLGTEDDWVALRARADKLGSLMVPEFSNYWMPLLLPVLDEFVESYRGNVNHGFWQSMVKLRHTGGGSGAHSFVSGWVQIFFPYLASDCLNKRLSPWHEMYFQGPELHSIPLIASAAPVDWDYHGAVFDLTFHSGVLGCSQHPRTGAISPFLGWYVSHVPPKSPRQQLKDVKTEIDALLSGHKEEAAAEVVDKSKPWYQRVLYLRGKESDIGETLTK